MSNTTTPSTGDKKIFVKSFKIRFYPTKDQIEPLAQHFGSCRFVYNKLLESSKLNYENWVAAGKIKETKPNVSAIGLTNKVMDLKVKHPWLYTVSAKALQRSARNLGKAYTGLFSKGKGFPKFKSKYDKQSFSLDWEGVRIKEGKAYIARFEQPLKTKERIVLPSTPKEATISRTTTGKYYISLVCEFIPEKTNGTKHTGIDLGIKHYAVMSDGTKIDNPKYYEKAQAKLARLQRAHSRKKKGSKNREKCRQRVAQCHEKVSNLRSNFLHQLSRKLINDNQVIGMEDLAVKNMVKNRCLSKAISSASWSEFYRQMSYKADHSQHCNLIRINRWIPSSHLCSSCGEQRAEKLTLSEREWTCGACGTIHDRDINAAINILHEAETSLAIAQIPPCTNIVLRS